MLKLREAKLVESERGLREIPEGKILINCLNAYSYNVAQKDSLFAESLIRGDYLIPDGASIVMACKWLKAKSQPQRRIAGWDLFAYEMQRLDGKSKKEEVKSKVMFIGSSEKVLALIRERAKLDFPHIEVETYSPPYKKVFSDEDNQAIIKVINDTNPDLLWIGMTAPRQEKWIYTHWDNLNIQCHVGTIGAVFDFYAGTAKRAPIWWQEHSLEWLFRLLMEPSRMWRRYLIGNPLFLWNILRER
jgi:N-acetylglucosaminyldiphosphoundecaprenol N-acetyl-beta-D-mannosaminyltransferase